MKKNILIAVTIIASLCVLYWGIEYLKGINLFTPANFYYAKFEKVDGLTDAAPITINGFKVGQIRGISYDYEKNEILVMMAMNNSLKIPVGSTVHVESNITGSATLALDLATSGQFYKVGDELQGVSKDGLLDRIGDDVMPKITLMLPKVDSILASANSLVSDPALKASVQRLDIITADLAKTSRELSVLMNRLNSALPPVLNNVGTVADNLTGTTANLNTFSASLAAMPLDSTLAHVNTTVQNLERLSAQLNSPDSSLGLLLNDKRLYNSADKAVASLDSLLTDIKAHPKRYVTIKVF